MKFEAFDVCYPITFSLEIFHITYYINPSSFNIQIRILQTNLHIFPYQLVERIYLKIKAFSDNWSIYYFLQHFLFIIGFIQKNATSFQGPPTGNVISQIAQKCTFPVYSNKTLRLELFASPTSLHFFSSLVLNW